MFHPVGNEPPSVYWRRRLVLIGGIVLVIVLLALTVAALPSSDGDTPVAGPASSPPVTPGMSPQSTESLSDPASSSGAATTPSGSGASSGSGSASGSAGSSAPPVACTSGQLDLAAAVAQSSYRVGDSPLLGIKIVNVGSAPCIADLADRQIVLRVYNGTSRVWGSHDCAVQPGTDASVLAVGKPALRQIKWNALTSEAGCKQATRQRVGAGSYTLYASLAGRNARAAQFSIG